MSRIKVKSPHTMIAIIGPTASGKSALAVLLAKRFGGEVVSADSRQVYRGLDIGSGKITSLKMRGVPHHLLDVANPSRTFTVAQYQRLAKHAIDSIWRRGNIPILCGGTGFYLDAVLKGTTFPQVKPNARLRKQLAGKTAAELWRLLYTKDATRARTIDRHNKRRLIRAVEIANSLGAVPKVSHSPSPYNLLIIGVNKNRYELQRLIKRRLAQRMKRGLVSEVNKLHQQGISWRKLESFGLEYRAVAKYLQGKLTLAEMKAIILRASWQYARRQMTWFKRLPHVCWVTNQRQALRAARAFMEKKKPVPR